MAWEITQGEIEYQAAQVLTGKTYKVFLAVAGNLTVASNVSAWEAAELETVRGYTPLTGTVGSGSYSSANNRFEAPQIIGAFGPATGIGFTYDAVVIKLQGRTNAYAVNLLGTPVTLSAGQSRGFQFTLGIKS
jgi:hypothetical protein